MLGTEAEDGVVTEAKDMLLAWEGKKPRGRALGAQAGKWKPKMIQEKEAICGGHSYMEDVVSVAGASLRK